MSARTITGDLSVFTIDAATQLAFAKSAQLSLENVNVDGSPLSRMYQSAQWVKKSGTVRADLMTTVSAPQKAVNLEVTAVGIGGVASVANVESFDISIDWQHDEGSGIGDIWRFPIAVKKDIRMSGVLLAPATASELMTTEAWSETLSDMEVVMTATFNSVTVTFPALLTGWDMAFNDGAIQRYNFEAIGRDPDSGNMPTAPTASTTLLEQALNATAANALAITTKAATNGIAMAGNGLIRSYNLQFASEGLIMVQAEWATQGAWTATEN